MHLYHDRIALTGANRFTTSLYLTASEDGQHSATAAAVAAATAAIVNGSATAAVGPEDPDALTEDLEAPKTPTPPSPSRSVATGGEWIG